MGQLGSGLPLRHSVSLERWYMELGHWDKHIVLYFIKLEGELT
jgi:hypothetical protein